MDAETTVCFRNVERTPQVQRLIESRARRLARVHPEVARCRVVVERASANHQRGNDLCAVVRAVAPGAEIVGRARAADEEGGAAAVADAFRAVERQLQDRAVRRSAGRRRGAGWELGDAA